MHTNKDNPMRPNRSREAVIASAATFVLTSIFYTMAYVLYPAALLGAQ